MVSKLYDSAWQHPSCANIGPRCRFSDLDLVHFGRTWLCWASLQISFGQRNWLSVVRAKWTNHILGYFCVQNPICRRLFKQISVVLWISVGSCSIKQHLLSNCLLICCLMQVVLWLTTCLRNWSLVDQTWDVSLTVWRSTASMTSSLPTCHYILLWLQPIFPSMIDLQIVRLQRGRSRRQLFSTIYSKANKVNSQILTSRVMTLTMNYVW